MPPGREGRRQEGQRQLAEEALRDLQHEGRRGLRHHVEVKECSFKLSYLNLKMGHQYVLVESGSVASFSSLWTV